MNYNFHPEISELFKEAGWYEGRNVKDSLEIPLEKYPNYSQLSLVFLYEFGGLKINGSKDHIASVGIDFSPNRAKYENEEDSIFYYYSNLTKDNLIPIG